MKNSIRVHLFFLLPVLFLVFSCGSDSSSDPIGKLSLCLADAASGDYKAVYVTVKQVQVRKSTDAEGVWRIAAYPNKTYNLFDLVNGVVEQLGISTLSAGHYTQMRLVLGEEPDSTLNILGMSHPYAQYVIDGFNGFQELKVPSSLTSGVKLIHEFDIADGLTTDLILDFQVDKSIVKAGAGGNYLLKPVIRIVGTDSNGIVSGIVTDESLNPLPGSRVTAQTCDSGTGVAATHGSTLADDDGGYSMYLDPGTYTIVAYKDGYGPVCSNLITVSNEEHDRSFALSASTTADLVLNVILARSDRDQYVSIRLRKTAPCNKAGLIEIKTLNVSQSGSYSVSLPAGTYGIVASNGAAVLVREGVLTGTTATLDFTG